MKRWWVLLVLGCGPSIEMPDGAMSGGATDSQADPYRGVLRVDGDSLLHMDPNTGDTSLICELAGLGDAGMQSLAFTRDGRIFGIYDREFLYEVDACACEATEVGAIGFSGLAGITPDDGVGLWGIASDQDQLIRIDPDTAAGVAIGALGRDVTNQGATWSEDDQTLYVLLGSGPAEVHTADPQTGALSFMSTVGDFFTTVGFEYHPHSGALYGCTADGILQQIDPVTGTSTVVGETSYADCDNLAAPPVPTANDCLP